MDKRRLFYVAVLSLGVLEPELANVGPGGGWPWTGQLQANASVHAKASPAGDAGTPQTYATNAQEKSKPICRAWNGQECTACGIVAPLKIAVKNKTKTPLLLCRNMKPGPVRVEMTTHAEPTIPGLWEVEFGTGYRTSTRSECPHQFIASNNPPLKPAYEIGPIAIETEIPRDGTIEILVCVGLSSARVDREGKETGASLEISKLTIVTE